MYRYAIIDTRSGSVLYGGECGSIESCLAASTIRVIHVVGKSCVGLELVSNNDCEIVYRCDEGGEFVIRITRSQDCRGVGELAG